MDNITDPFARTTLATGPGAQAEAPVSSFDETEGTISRGMPKKNFKVFAIFLLAVIVAAGVFWPQDKDPVSKNETAPPEATNKVAAQGIVDALATPDPTQPIVPQSGPSNPVFSLPPRQQQGAIPPGSQVDFQGGELTPAQRAALDAQARQEEIIASSMTPGDFSLEQRQRANTAGSNERLQPPGQGLSELLQSQERILAGMNTQQGNSQPQEAQQTRRDPNVDFLQNAGNQTVGTPDQMISSPPKNALLQGTIVRGVLLSGINTQVPGEFRARVVSDIFDSSTQRNLIVPRGSIIIGAYRSSILVGQSRMVLAAQRLIMPNGKSVNLRGAVLGDQAGVAGMPGEVENHFWTMFKASAIVGAASLLLPKDQQIITSTVGFGGQQTGGTILAKSLSDVVTRIAQRNSAIGPTGSVDAGEVFTLMIQRDIAMEPYKW
jgi:type IV secretion system protein TrbI